MGADHCSISISSHSALRLMEAWRLASVGGSVMPVGRANQSLHGATLFESLPVGLVHGFLQIGEAVLGWIAINVNKLAAAWPAKHVGSQAPAAA